MITEQQLPASTPYDAIAEFYRRAWRDWYLPFIRPALEKVLYSVLNPGARILDVCCGCAHITRDLVRQGYRVVGVDSSAALLDRAREECPQATFVVSDVRTLQITRQFEGALSTFDSLNHMLVYEDLVAALRSVQKALRPGAPFFFDMNLPEAYRFDLTNWVRYRDETAIGWVRGTLRAETGRVATELMWFYKAKPTDVEWQLAEACVEEQCYPAEVICQAITEAGFERYELFNADGAGVSGDLSFGRLYVRAWA